MNTLGYLFYGFENEGLVFSSQPVVTDLTAISPVSTSERKKSQKQNTVSPLLFPALIFPDLLSEQQEERREHGKLPLHLNRKAAFNNPMGVIFHSI